MNYLIAGLGNIGSHYAGTRHNIGFMVLDAFAKASNIVFEDRRYGYIAQTRLKGRIINLLKPSTYMNLSGNAVRYWLKKNRVEIENLLVIVDDISLPFGSLRLKAHGSSAGHNGLNHIETILSTQQYARLRFGIGSNFPQGGQSDYVLSPFEPEEEEQLPARIEVCTQIITSFCLEGTDRAMNRFNNK